MKRKSESPPPARYIIPRSTSWDRHCSLRTPPSLLASVFLSFPLCHEVRIYPPILCSCLLGSRAFQLHHRRSPSADYAP